MIGFGACWRTCVSANRVRDEHRRSKTEKRRRLGRYEVRGSGAVNAFVQVCSIRIAVVNSFQYFN